VSHEASQIHDISHPSSVLFALGAFSDSALFWPPLTYSTLRKALGCQKIVIWCTLEFANLSSFAFIPLRELYKISIVQ
jgi:hypothetical protein